MKVLRGGERIGPGKSSGFDANQTFVKEKGRRKQNWSEGAKDCNAN